MGEAVASADVPDQQNEEYVEAEVFTEVPSGTSSEKFVKINETVAATDIPGQNNEEAAESEVLHEGASGDPEDMDVD